MEKLRFFMIYYYFSATAAQPIGTSVRSTSDAQNEILPPCLYKPEVYSHPCIVQLDESPACILPT